MKWQLIQIGLLLLPSLTLAQTANDVANQALQQAKTVIAGMVQGNPRLTPEFIRMGFHDCVGGCDGCIDLANPDNNGLAHPISVLDPVVQQFANANTGLSRADIWALASMVGADVANHGTVTQPISFTQKWFGRINCENANAVCRNAQGQAVACSKTAGPHRDLPTPEFNSAQVFSYFATNFGFNERQTVTAMGAHSVGRLVKSESGIDGPNGWTINNVNLQNEYYNALMGAATAATPLSQIADNSPNWVRKFEDNTGTGLPNRNRWQLDVASLSLVMLNTDIGLVRDLNATVVDPKSGAVSCTFNSQTGSPACAVRASSAQIAAQFSDSNDLWLSEFKAVMDLILTNGYLRLQCTSAVCPLTSSRIGPPIAAPTNKPTPPPVMKPIAPVPATAPSPYIVPGAKAPTISGWRLTKLGSNAKRVSVGNDGTLGMVDRNANISISNMGGYWAQLPGWGIIDIAVIDKSRLFVIGGDYNIYRWNGSNGWKNIASGVTSIAAAADGTLAAVKYGQIFVKNGYNDYVGWKTVPYVSGAIRVTAVKNGWVYYTGSDHIIYYSDMVNKPVRVGHSSVEISASLDGSLVTANDWNDIWFHYGGKNVETWYQVPGKAITVTVFNSKSLVAVGSDGTITRYDYML